MMKSMKKVIFAMLAAALCACAGKGGFSYTVTVDSPDGAEVRLLSGDDESELAEAVYDENSGLYHFKGKAEVPMIAYVVDELNEPLTAIFLEEGDIFVGYDADEDRFVISGTPANDNFAEANDRMSSVVAELYDIDEEQQKAVMEEYWRTADEIIDENGDNMLGVYLFCYTAESHMTPSEILERLDRFPAALQNTTMLSNMRLSVEASLKVAVGSDYTEIVAPDAGGVDVALSSVVGNGKWVLVDFWATWCGPCRGELPYLKEAYEKYADRGFEIYGVSLDNNIEAWKAFVDENGMNWVNVADIREDRTSPAADAYGIRSIPSNFLISPEGKIVARDLRGEGVEEKLAEIF